jgi:predicted Holliday junction resolvase-like endonuclease
MLDPTQTPALLVVGGLLAAAVLIILVLWLRYEKLLKEHEDLIREARKDSVDRSRRTLKGQIAEQMAPHLPGFVYSAADARFLGDPIDYVVFNGCSESRDNADPESDLEIVLLEIKHGQSRLTPVQRAIGRAIEAGRIRFEVNRVLEDGTVATEAWRPSRNRALA